MKAKDLPFAGTRASILAGLVAERIPPGDVPQEEWEEMVPLAARHGLGPMLLWILRQHARVMDEDPRWEMLIAEAREVAIQAALLDDARQRLDAALGEACIPALWLKGMALAHTVYPEPRLRPMADLDVLVPSDQRREALVIAEGLGFHPPAVDYLSAIGAPLIVRHHDHLLRDVGGRLVLEIHFRLLGSDGSRLLPEQDMAWFWSQASTQDGPGFTILRPEAHLLYLCAHAILQHGEAGVGLLHLFDLHRLVIGSHLDWQLVVTRALALRWSYAVERALELAVDYFGTPVPENVLAQLQARLPGDDSLMTAARLRNRVARWEEWKVIFRRLPPADRARLVWTTLFPPGRLMRELYSIRPAGRVFPYYLYRWWDGGREVIRAMRAQWVKN